MSQINCLKCKQAIDAQYDHCPHCGEKVTLFQRTYASRLLDGKYQILDRLGIGGMGEIFKVRHIHLNELRVIKIMRPNVAADDQGLQRFLQEARTSTMIKHKNLAMLYDFAQLEDGSYYMVWEFIDGTNIQKWIAQNGADAAAAHRRDRHSGAASDSSTSTRWVSSIATSRPRTSCCRRTITENSLVKVIDFGIAKQLAEGEGGQGLTQTGMFLGKLKYASPEQAGFLKENEHLDPRSDLYSFGIVMYEMLAGRAPFQATNPHGYILKHVTEKPAPIHELNPGVKVPPQLESIIMKSLEKNRDDALRDRRRVRARARSDPQHDPARPEVRPRRADDHALRRADARRSEEHRTGQSGTFGGAQQTQQTQQTMGSTPQPTQQTFAGGPGGTMPGQRVGPTGTRVGSDEATVMERNLTAAGSGKIGSDEATVMERFGAAGAAPTSIEQK